MCYISICNLGQPNKEIFLTESLTIQDMVYQDYISTKRGFSHFSMAYYNSPCKNGTVDVLYFDLTHSNVVVIIAPSQRKGYHLLA